MRKKRIGFDVKKDVFLLRTALQLNPWQLGDDKWKEVVDTLNKELDVPVVLRTVKNRVELLLQKFRTQELTTK